MNRQSLMIEGRAIAASILFLVIGFLALWLMKAMLNMEQDIVLVSMLLVPILVYMIVSGRLKEISGPGGLSATLNNVARTPIEEQNTEPITADEVQEIMATGGMPELQDLLRDIGRFTFVVLTVTVGQARHYDAGQLAEDLEALSQHPKFKFLVVLDQDKKVIGYIATWRAKQILKVDPDRFVQVLNRGRKQDLQPYELFKTTVENTDTNIKALQKMTDQNMEALVVVDKNGRLEGVVERDQILSKLMLAMTK